MLLVQSDNSWVNGKGFRHAVETSHLINISSPNKCLSPYQMSIIGLMSITQCAICRQCIKALNLPACWTFHSISQLGDAVCFRSHTAHQHWELIESAWNIASFLGNHCNIMSNIWIHLCPSRFWFNVEMRGLTALLRRIFWKKYIFIIFFPRSECRSTSTVTRRPPNGPSGGIGLERSCRNASSPESIRRRMRERDVFQKMLHRALVNWWLGIMRLKGLKCARIMIWCIVELEVFGSMFTHIFLFLFFAAFSLTVFWLQEAISKKPLLLDPRNRWIGLNNLHRNAYASGSIWQVMSELYMF